MAARRANRLATAAAEAMGREFGTVEIGDGLAKVYARAQRQHNTFFPVLENHRLRGVIDQGGLAAFLPIRAALSHQAIRGWLLFFVLTNNALLKNTAPISPDASSVPASGFRLSLSHLLRYET